MNRNRMAEIKNAIQSRYSQRLLNDTKWREIWTLLTKFGQHFRMQYANSDVWNADNKERLHYPLPSHDVLDNGIRDPGVGGPFRYFEIYSIEIPKTNQEFGIFYTHLTDLGTLPLIDHHAYIEILGYRE